MLLGLRVVRGPDWNLGSLDGEEGGVGTIVSAEISQNGRPLPEKSVLVYWDSGPAVVCRVGLGDCYDLRVYDSAPAGVLHSHFNCDECDQSGIAGIRFHCSECHDYDLCSDCYMNDRHNKDHNFVRFEKPNNRTDGTFLEDRLNAAKVRAKGIFPGATVRRGQHLTLDNDLGSTVGQVVEFTALKGKPRSAVMIQWSYGPETIHRAGYEGKVDLELVECADGPLYYKDHLPIVEYQSADTQGDFRVGDQVKLNKNHETVKKIAQENGRWPPNGNDSLGGVGRIVKIDDDDNVHVAYGPSWIFHRDVLQKVPELQVQDDVKDINQFLEVLLNAFQDIQHELGEALDTDKEGAVIQEIDGNVDVDALFNFEGVLEHSEMTEQEKKEKLFQASSADDLQMVQYILTLDEDLVNEKSEGGKAPLHLACQNGNANVVSCLIEKGADLEIKDEEGYTPLHLAAHGDKTGECVVLLLTANAFVNVISAKTKVTPLHLAIDAGNVTTVSALMLYGQCDVNYQNISGNTSLHCAVFAEDSSILAEILKVPSIDPFICNNNGLNALQLACQRNNITSTRALMNKFPELIDVKNQDGFAPLHLAVISKHCDIAKLLINEGHCSIDLPDSKGATPLALAVSLLHKEMIELLMECGANVNTVDNEGETPLHIAALKYFRRFPFEHNKGTVLVHEEHSEEMKLYNDIMTSLLSRGADVNLKNNQGDVPLAVLVEDDEYLLKSIEQLLQAQSASSPSNVPSQPSLKELLKKEANIVKLFSKVSSPMSSGFSESSNRFKVNGSEPKSLKSNSTTCHETNMPAREDYGARNPGSIEDNEHTVCNTIADGMESSVMATASEERGRTHKGITNAKTGVLPWKQELEAEDVSSSDIKKE